MKNIYMYVSVLFVLLAYVCAANNNGQLYAVDFARSEGYNVDVISITTKDGYVLPLFRITTKKACKCMGPAVLLLHGHVGTCDVFVALGKEKALAFNLADACYIVYLGNIRSNNYAHHTSLSKEDCAYWNYSLDEVALYDISANIDYIYNHHGKVQIIAFGYSAGLCLILLSDRPCCQGKVDKMIFISPSAYMFHSKSPAVIVGAQLLGCTTAQYCGNFLKVDEIFGPIGDALCGKACGSSCGFVPECDVYATMMSKPDPIARQRFLINHPSGSSINEVKHRKQGACLKYKYRDFTHFDCGLECNRLRYNSDISPPYNLESISNNIMIIYGSDDMVSDPVDIHKLIIRLPNVNKVLILHGLNQYDLLLASDANEKVNSPALKYLLTPKNSCNNRCPKGRIVINIYF